jgi:DHA1 family multidrug resistance protein-like MFS transporter
VPDNPAQDASDAQPSRPVQDWRILLAIYSVTSLIEAIGVSQIFAFLPARLREIGLPQGDVAAFTGIFTALIFVVGIFLVPFWGVWADKISRRAVIVRSAVVEAVVFGAVALAAEPWQLAAALLLTGLQLGNTGVMLAALRDVSPTRRVGTMSAIFSATGPVGFAVGPAIGGVMVDGLHLPLVAVFWSSSVLSVAVIALLMLGSREVRPAVVPRGGTFELAMSAVRGALSDPAVRRVFTIFGVAILGNLMTRPYVPLLVERITGSGEGLASGIALVVGTAALIGALGSPLSGPLGDRLGLRTVLVGALVLGGLSVAPMPLAPSVVGLAGLSIVYAAAFATVQAMVFGLLAVQVPPERRSATLNLVLLPLYVAGIIGPSLAAGFAATVGVPAVYPVAGAIMIASAVIVSGLVRATRPEP